MASLSVTPEQRLCLLLARGELSPAARERARELLALPLQWPRVLQFAYAQQVLPLMYQNLTRLGFPGVPHSVEAELRHAFGTNALRNSLLARELARLLAVLDEAGIPAIPLKGVALAEALYGDSGLRVCSDIDILVPAKNFADAFRLFSSSGYRPEIMQLALLRLVARYGKDCEFFPDDAKRTYTVSCIAAWSGEDRWNASCSKKCGRRLTAEEFVGFPLSH